MQLVRIFLAVLACSSTTTSHASFNFSGDQLADESRYEQRERYKKLLYQIKTNQHSRYESGKAALANYPLYPYLEYQSLIFRLSKQTSASIDEFVTQYGDTPLAGQLLQNWLYSLGKRGEWKTFESHFDANADNTKENACYHAYTMWRANRIDEALRKAKDLWLVPFSQPDECDPIFKVWRDADGLSREVAWQRYESAITKNQITLGTYLERFLDRADKSAAARLKRFHTKPRQLNRKTAAGPDSERGRFIVSHGIERLARRDAKQALETLNQIRGQYQFSPETLTHLYTEIGIRLARNPNTLGLLEDLPIDLTADEKLVEAQLLTHLKQLNWSTALVFLNLLPDESQASLRWQYWQARILLGSGSAADVQEGRDIFINLSKERSFYGFMAADTLKLPYSYEDTPEAISHEQVHALEETPGIQRALELFALDEKTRARREWNFTTQDFSDIELRIAARVAEKWGWHEQAIRAMITAKAWDDLGPRFPIAYRDNFITGARTEDIPLTWSMAIARQESAFMTDAKSSAGALGLMQLMPATARQVAREQGIPLRSSNQLTDPLTNIQLGTAYLGKMFRRFNHNRILASAAYNAGPKRVSGWLDSSLPLDVWIETIPFSETRNYVQNVLVFSSIYSRKLGQNTPLIFAHERRDFSNPEVGLNSP
ncbi:MAG: soluble lytic murein transglycosylase [Candidatus Azotimanducaceae bacterium]|jgi:soluble lytic murein transglycosylase